MINKIISAVILTGFIFMLGGCGDGEAESAPPVANMRLLSRMFESMERGDYVSAGEQYRKYELSTEEGISPLWGVVIKSNRVIQQVQKHLDAGDLDGALAGAREAKLSDPLNMDIDKLVSELEFLTVLRDSVAGVRSAGESTALDESLRRLSEAIAKEPQKTAPLKGLVTDGVKRLAEMRRRENRLRRADLLMEIYAADLASDKVLSTLQAQYEVEKRAFADDPLPEAVENELYKRGN